MLGVIAALETQSTQKLRPQNTGEETSVTLFLVECKTWNRTERKQDVVFSTLILYKFWRDENFM